MRTVLLVFGCLLMLGCLADAESNAESDTVLGNGGIQYPTTGLNGLPNVLSLSKTNYSNILEPSTEAANGRAESIGNCRIELPPPYCPAGEAAFTATVPVGRSLRIVMKYITPYSGDLDCYNADVCTKTVTWIEDIGDPNDPNDDQTSTYDCFFLTRTSVGPGPTHPEYPRIQAECGDCYDCFVEQENLWWNQGASAWQITTGTELYQTREQVYTPTTSGTVEGKLILRNSGSVEIQYYEDGATDPTRTKLITW